MSGVSKALSKSLSALIAATFVAASTLGPANAQLSAPRLASAAAARPDTASTEAGRFVVEVKDRRRRHHDRDRAAIIGGILGLTTGLIIAGSQNRGGYYYYDPYDDPYYRDRYYRDRYYYDRRHRQRGFFTSRTRRYYEPPVVVYRGRYEPWSPEWYAYCSRRYRSFNPRTGYFLGYDGVYHFCR